MPTGNALASATYRIAEPDRYPIWRLIATKTVAKAIIGIFAWSRYRNTDGENADEAKQWEKNK